MQLSLRSSKKAKPHPMKCFDWKEVAMDKVLSQNFSLEVYNRFYSLCDLAESIEDTYDTLISCTEEVAKEMLPRKKKSQSYEPANSSQVSQAREKLKATSLKYHKTPTRSMKQQLSKAKKSLDNAYLEAEADFIMGKIVTLEHLHSSNKYHMAWKTVKELSGKSNSSPRIKGGSS